MDKKNQPIKVYARSRPFKQTETDIKTNVVQHITTKEVVLKKDFNERRYNFEHVFSEMSGQIEVFNVVVAPMIPSVIGGYNCTIMAHGPTGSGKAYTIFGEQKPVLEPDLRKDSTVGLVPRAAEHLFLELSKENVKTEYTVQVSFYEVYNEEVRDLLAEYTALRVYDDPMNKGTVCIKDLSKVTVFNTRDVNEWLTIGQKECDGAHSKLNIDPSKTHLVFTFSVNVRELNSKGDEIIKTGKLQFVKLASSENTKTSGERLRDAATINRSIITVGKVIKSLAQKMQHIPYRDSKLTRILQDSLAGPSKTSMIFTFSPYRCTWDETINCLDLANQAKTIQNYPLVNLRKKQASLLEEIQDEIVKLRGELAAARSGDGFYVSTETYQKMREELDVKNKTIIEAIQQVNELEDHLKTQKTDFDILIGSFQKTKEHLSSIENTLKEKVESNRREEARINNLRQNYNKVTEKTSVLLDICETSTKNLDVIHKKFEDKCETNVTNATIAKRVIDSAFNCLRSLTNLTLVCEQHETNHFTEINQVIQSLRNKNRESLCAIMELQKEIAPPHSLMGKLDELARPETQRFIKDIYQNNSGNMHFLAEIKHSLAHWKELCEQKRNEVKERALQCFRDIKEELELRSAVESEMIDLLKKVKADVSEKNSLLCKSFESDKELVKQILASQERSVTEETSLLAEAVAIKLSMDAILELKAKRNKRNQDLTQATEGACSFMATAGETTATLSAKLSEVINKFEGKKKNTIEQTNNDGEKINDYVRNMTADLETKISDNSGEVKNLISEWGKKLDELKNKIMNFDIKNSTQMEFNILNVSQKLNSQNCEIQSIIGRILEQIQQNTSDINFTGHVGDTPVRRRYNIPKHGGIEENGSDKEN